ncbi:TIGR03111 family XrtG-associated glycosyltransferase [Cellulosilyticum sp. I15G10I2]|uniref:TIGR03111 family XrtG-associated glycosyltransferase n=1 Tax=Cellulosilyticum sp. I15G10I2 TaxID=1892843 RepID=UPI00085BF06E|nr:TIGR03111 family XrtG-associated glycosyltransferase [Cellulosilyticum sp. I15G10I2]
MEMIFSRTLRTMIFWMAWIIIPFIMEIIPAIGGFFILLKKKFLIKREAFKGKLPQITVIVPVYNSADTLSACLGSIYHSNYPMELIDVLLVDNMSSDNSFEIFTQAQRHFEGLSMSYLNSKQGKSKALNMALFNSTGKYIIHIDSDGQLEKDALKNMIIRFEQNQDIHCMTGVILVDPVYIKKTKGLFLRILRDCEFFEYAQAFLAGRNFESELGSIYTVSGAFSSFRKSVVLKTQLYNSETVCEDTQITFQMRHLLKKNVHLCEEALFFVDPIEDFNKLYTQRQRWQRGEIEVSHMFLQHKMSAVKGFFSNFMIRLLIYDHTFAFPRLIWYFALIFLVFMNYPFELVIGSVFIIYLLYVFSGFLFYLNISMYLRNYEAVRIYYTSRIYMIFLLPVFNFIIFWIRFAGIINSIKGERQWKTLNLKEEYKIFTTIAKRDFDYALQIIRRIRKRVNNE